MIVKSLSRKSGNSSQLLSYIFRYVLEKGEKERKEKPKEKSFIIRHNLRARSIKGYIREFEKLEASRQYKRSNSVQVYHNILSFSAKDSAHISDAVLKDLADKFIALRGKDNLYVGTKHTDRDHIHLHIAMSAVDLAGRSVRISQSKFQALKQELDRYQKEQYPELSNSLPDHGKKQRDQNKEVKIEAIKFARTTEQATLSQVLEATYSKSDSLEHFLAELSQQGYAAYYRSGSLTGITTEGNRKFRLARLGYPQEKLKLLDAEKEREEKELAELKALREGRSERAADRLATLNEAQQKGSDERETDVPDTDVAEQTSRQDNDTRSSNDQDTNKDTDEQERDSDNRDERDDSDDDDGRNR